MAAYSPTAEPRDDGARGISAYPNLAKFKAYTRNCAKPSRCNQLKNNFYALNISIYIFTNYFDIFFSKYE